MIGPAANEGAAVKDSNGSPGKEGVPDDYAYWRRQLTPQPELVNLPADYPRTAEHAFRAARLTVKVSDDLAAGLRSDSTSQQTFPPSRLFVKLLGCWQILVWRLSGNADPVILIPAAAEQETDYTSRAGHAAEWLPIRLAIEPEMRVDEYFGALAAVAGAAYEHRHIRLDVLLRELAPPLQGGRIRLSEVSFRAERTRASEFPVRQSEEKADGTPEVESDISLIVVEEDELVLECDYNAELYAEETIRSWLDCYCSLLEATLAKPSGSVGLLPLLNSETRKYLLEDCNATATEPLAFQSIPELLADAFRAMPTEPAVEFYGLQYSRARLAERSDRLACRLIRHGAGPGSLVAIYMDRSVEMLVGVLAVLKAGAAYVPLDPKLPLARMEQITSETRPAVLLTLSRHLEDLPKTDSQILVVDREAAALAKEPIGPLPEISQGTVAYVIFTSGSTGRPKGVEVTHGSVVNLLTDLRQRLDVGPQDRLLAITTLAFDISVLELLLPLISGGTVVIATQEDAGEGQALLDLLTETRTTILQATPFTFRMLLEAGFKSRPGFKMLCGGEMWTPALGEGLLAGGGRLWNMYGPTETTVWSSVSEVARGTKRITIGPPVANTRFYVVDQRQQLVPPGVPGELLISGSGVARGYFNRAELTAEKFLADPFRVRAGERVYRTGDEVRQLPDGRIEFLGRLDQQIKLRGFRIEPGDIEAAMADCPGVRNAVVTRHRDMAGEDLLVGFYTADSELSAGKLREWLKSRVPAYMIPSVLRQVDGFPLTPNGKIDRRALPDPEASGSDPAGSHEEAGEFEATDVESRTGERMYGIWRKIFEGKEVRDDSDFFELGGDSLSVVRLQSMITRQFDVHLTMADIARRPTPGALIARVEELLSNAHPLAPIRPTNPRVLPVYSMEAERPIFLIPQMLIFWHLAEQLGANQSVYALQLLDEDVPPRMESASFEELATLYYNLIREVQPEGPYRLGGWCLWGLMAYEVARLLEQGGAEVDLVMIIDTWAPGAWTGHSTPRRLGLIAAHLWHRLRWIAARVLRGSGEKRRRDLLRGLRVVIEPLAPWLPERLRVNRPVTELGRLERLVSDAAASYEPGPLKGKVLLFKGEQRAAGTSFGEDMGWTRVLGRYVAMNELPGDHSEIFELPGAQIMAARVREALGLEMEP